MSKSPAPAPFQPPTFTVTPSQAAETVSTTHPAIVPTPVVHAAPETPAVAKMPKAKTTKREIPSESNDVIGAKITIMFRNEKGEVMESAFTVSDKDYAIQNYTLETKKGTKRIEEDGDYLYEDTGERALTFKLKYNVK